MKPQPLLIVDYGLGNLFSLRRALLHAGAAEVAVSSDPEAVRRADRLILPGVAAFGDGMKGLTERGLAAPLLEFARRGGPLLGLCLGMQLLMDEGTEFGVHKGLGLIPGKCLPLPPAPSLKIPHVGWNDVSPADGAWKGTILDDLGPRPQMYFVHSYAAVPARREDWLAETSYGGKSFCSALRHGNIVGCQFHPEKSGPVGLRLLSHFVDS